MAKKKKDPTLSEREVKDFPKEEEKTEETFQDQEAITQEAAATQYLGDATNKLVCFALNNPIRSMLEKQGKTLTRVEESEIKDTGFGEALAKVMSLYLKVPDHPLTILIAAGLGLATVVAIHLKEPQPPQPPKPEGT